MTDEELRIAAKKYWTVNKKNAEVIAKALIARHSLPPVVGQLPGMPEFLADCQRSFFLWGAAAVIDQMRSQAEEIQALARELKMELTEKAVDPGILQ